MKKLNQKQKQSKANKISINERKKPIEKINKNRSWLSKQTNNIKSYEKVGQFMKEECVCVCPSVCE